MPGESPLSAKQRERLVQLASGMLGSTFPASATTPRGRLRASCAAFG